MKFQRSTKTSLKPATKSKRDQISEEGGLTRQEAYQKAKEMSEEYQQSEGNNVEQSN